MEEKYFTIEEAAKLEGITYEGFKLRIYRNSESYKTKTEPSDNGGKDRILVAISSLSVKGKKAYKSKMEIEELSIEDEDNSESTWYLDVDLHWYIENNKKYYYKAVELSSHIEKYLEESRRSNNKDELASKYAKMLKISTRSLYRKTKAYLMGMSWANKVHEIDGKNYDFYKVLALSRKPNEKDKFSSLSEELKAFIENMWANPKFTQNQSHTIRIHEAVVRLEEEKGWHVPHYSTVARYITYLKEQVGNKRDLLEKGKKKFIADGVLKGRRDPGALEVMEMVMGDGHTFDCWVAVQKSNGTWDAVRPHLLAWIDLKSRCIVSHAICEVPDAFTMAKTIVNMMYPKKDERIPFEGCPKYIYIDNGKEYTAEYLTGRNRTERFDFSMEAKGFYRSIGIIDDIRAIPYYSWSKSYVERYFGSVCTMFTKGMDSYTGTLTGSKTAGKVKKDIPKMLKNGELMTIDEFAKLFDTWLNEIYHLRKHSGLKRQKELSPIPLDVYRDAERYYKPAPPYEYAEILLMKADKVHVYNTGIEKFGVTYIAQELGKFIGSKVMVRYNPDDITKVYVYTLGNERICEAVSYELLQIAPKISSKQYEDFAKLKGNQLKGARETLKELQTPYEERILAKNKVLIMPELKGENPKVVSLPIDSRFKDSIKEKKTEKKVSKKELIENKFFEQQANEAFAMLENL